MNANATKEAMTMSDITTKNTGHSSRRFGPCEVCGGHAAEVHIRRIGINHVFGHEACLRGDAAAIMVAANAFQVSHHGAPAR